MQRKYYVLFCCDEWKSRSSMSLVGVFTLKQLIKVIKERVKKGDFEFKRDIKEIDSLEPYDIDVSLEYGYIQETSINEVLN